MWPKKRAPIGVRELSELSFFVCSWRQEYPPKPTTQRFAHLEPFLPPKSILTSQLASALSIPSSAQKSAPENHAFRIAIAYRIVLIFAFDAWWTDHDEAITPFLPRLPNRRQARIAVSSYDITVLPIRYLWRYICHLSQAHVPQQSLPVAKTGV